LSSLANGKIFKTRSSVLATTCQPWASTSTFPAKWNAAISYLVEGMSLFYCKVPLLIILQRGSARKTGPGWHGRKGHRCRNLQGPRMGCLYR
jgi:hypothetical protein